MNEIMIDDEKNMRSLLQLRSAELFRLCDTENKGFINKKDIQRMKEPLSLSPELLEQVFDSLDYDKNGFLTLDEFTVGFSSYLGYQMNNNHFEEKILRPVLEEDTDEEEFQFKNTMEYLGAEEIVDRSESSIKELWKRLRKEDPMMLKAFENFVSNVSLELKKTKNDFVILENALQNKASVYDEQVRKLYEEMESQIKAEKSRILAQEKMKEKELKEKLDRDLREKERQLHETMAKQAEMEQKLSRLNSLEYQQKLENERLLKDKAMLEEQLNESFKNLQESKTYISILQQQTFEESRTRTNQARKITENIASERENLMRELNVVKDINKKLQDERDELLLQNPSRRSKSIERANRRLVKQGSILSNYIKPIAVTVDLDDSYEIREESVSDDEANANSEKRSVIRKASDEAVNNERNTEATETTPSSVVKLESLQLQSLPIQSLQSPPQPPQSKTDSSHYANILNVPANATPHRVFKIVLIGDSGVGKTSFVQRFCHDSFRESFSTTIGVDFQVKSILIDNRVIALQLWDTAGQERYRSITKQYFRKSDGVICMYDVTSEQSFKSMRSWIASVKENASDECVLTIIGNKLDLCENEESRVVKHKDGAALAEEYGTLFFEASSKKCRQVIEAMEAIARILQEREDKQIEDVLNLRVKEKKKSCCP